MRLFSYMYCVLFLFFLWSSTLNPTLKYVHRYVIKLKNGRCPRCRGCHCISIERARRHPPKSVQKYTCDKLKEHTLPSMQRLSWHPYGKVPAVATETDWEQPFAAAIPGYTYSAERTVPIHSHQVHQSTLSSGQTHPRFNHHLEQPPQKHRLNPLAYIRA